MPNTVSDLLLQNGIKDESLSHYGVKGMKWGQRRASKAAAKASKAAALKKPSVKDMSDDELRTRIARIKLEQEYTRLTAAPSTKSGRKEVAQLLKDVGKTQAKNYLNKGIPLIVDTMLDKSALTPSPPRHRK